MSEAVPRKCSVKKVFLKISQNLQKTPVPESSSIKLEASGNFIKKENLAKVFSYKLSEIFKNTFLINHHRWLLFEFVFI